MNKSGILVDFPGLAGAKSPQDVVVFFDDFLGASWNTSADAAVWNETLVAQAATGLSILDGTDDAEDEAGGVLCIETEATADDGENLQVNGHAFHFADGYPLYYEARLNIKDVSNMDLFIGLSVTDAEIITGGASDRCGFELSGGTLSYLSENTTAQKTVDTAITETDDQWIRVAFLWDGDNELKFYIDDDDDGEFTHLGTLKADVTAHYVCQDMMLTPTIEAIVGTTATTEIAYVDYVYCAQQRYKA